MTEEKIANELLELIAETVQDDMKYIMAGLGACPSNTNSRL
jgi:hypothetical protein